MLFPNGIVPNKWVPAVVLTMLHGVAHDQASFFTGMRGERPFAERTATPEQEQACFHLRVMMEQWLFSGKDPENTSCDTPTKRNLTAVHPTFTKPLLDTLNQWKDRHPPRLSFSNDGKVSIVYEEPQYHVEGGLYGAPKGTTIPKDIAIFWFVRMLDSPGAHSIARCANPECSLIYFLYLRTPKGTLRNGTFCRRCAANRSAIQTKIKQDDIKELRVRLALRFWNNWTPNRRGRDKAEWIKTKMNAELAPNRQVTRKWVVQNTEYIEERLGGNPS
jgi:hypothetical protein